MDDSMYKWKDYNTKLAIARTLGYNSVWEAFVGLYNDKNYSIKQVGAAFGIPGVGAYPALKKYKAKLRASHVARARKNHTRKMRMYDVTRTDKRIQDIWEYYTDVIAVAKAHGFKSVCAMIKYYYIKEELSSRIIGRMLGVSQRYVLDKLHAMGVKVRGKGGNNYSRYKKTKKYPY